MVNSDFWRRNQIPNFHHEHLITESTTAAATAVTLLGNPITPENFFDIIDIGSPTAIESGITYSNECE